ncbi:MAG: HTH luxR-type domain-containing protein [Nitrospira sp.]|nr:MAG: HTH luxR-type domain-containing protein [Nitrospira sp.]
MLAEQHDRSGDHQDATMSRSSMKNRKASADPEPAAPKRKPEELTPRELEILRLIWDGHTNRSIAGLLKISMKTADTHRANMMKKLRVSNTAQLLKAALEGKLLHTHDGSWRSDGTR